eukprot:1161603-Pelagomonas_calceolata.AAC.11
MGGHWLPAQQQKCRGTNNKVCACVEPVFGCNNVAIKFGCMQPVLEAGMWPNLRTSCHQLLNTKSCWFLIRFRSLATGHSSKNVG